MAEILAPLSVGNRDPFRYSRYLASEFSCTDAFRGLDEPPKVRWSCATYFVFRLVCDDRCSSRSWTTYCTCSTSPFSLACTCWVAARYLTLEAGGPTFLSKDRGSRQRSSFIVVSSLAQDRWFPYQPTFGRSVSRLLLQAMQFDAQFESNQRVLLYHDTAVRT